MRERIPVYWSHCGTYRVRNHEAVGTKPLRTYDDVAAMGAEVGTAQMQAHALYTDVWASMGQEEEQAERLRAFAGWCLDETLLSEADPRAIVLHCLPAYRGKEIAALGDLSGASAPRRT